MLKSSLLFYKILVKDLKEQGFTIKPYDPCVANKQVNRKQLTVTWHVDDLKVSSELKKNIDKFIQWIKNKYEDFTQVKPSQGKIRDYLVMQLNYKIPGKVKIVMIKYIQALIDDFPYQNELGNRCTNTPAVEHLFKINQNATKLNQHKVETFHTWTAKSLFLSKRSCLDIILTVAFLCTRVKDPDKDDWKKLLCLIIYFKCTMHLVLMLEATNLSIAQWWANAAFAVHYNIKSHTGSTFSLGKGTIQAISQKQKINTKSSTEAELMGTDDILSHLLWTKNFLEAQGYPSQQTILHQDNTSAILLECNGRDSAGKNSHHIHVCYF